MKNILMINDTYPLSDLEKCKIYGITLTAEPLGNQADIFLIHHLKKIYELGFVAYAKIIISTIDQAFGQFQSLKSNCDYIHLTVGTEKLNSNHLRILISRIAEQKTSTKILMDKKLMEGIGIHLKELPLNFTDPANI